MAAQGTSGENKGRTCDEAGVRRIAVLALAGLVSIGVAACGGDKNSRVVCPQVGILYDASRVTEFVPGGEPTLENVTYDAEIGDARISCKYDGDIVKSKVSFTLDMRAGPAAREDKHEFKYFVAVTELNSRILSKKVYSVEAKFDPETRRVVVTKDVGGLKVNYKRLGRSDLYEILVGWELTPEQLAYNRTHSMFDRPNLRRVPRP